MCIAATAASKQACGGNRRPACRNVNSQESLEFVGHDWSNGERRQRRTRHEGRCLKNPERVEYRSGFAISVQGYAERRFRCQVSAARRSHHCHTVGGRNREYDGHNRCNQPTALAATAPIEWPLLQAATTYWDLNSRHANDKAADVFDVAVTRPLS